MKRAQAILFMLALVCSQPLALPAASCDGPLPCCGCGGTMKCCLTGSRPSSADSPATPEPLSPQKDLQLLQSLPVCALFSFTAPNHQLAPQIFATPLAVAVPIFARDCAFLI